MNTKRNSVFVLIFILIILTFSYIFYHLSLDISGIIYSNKSESNNRGIAKEATPKDTFYIGVISRYPSNIIYKGYQPLIDYLNDNTSHHFSLKLSKSYPDALDKLVNKKVIASFFGSNLYVASREKYPIIPILKPLNENKQPYYRTVVFTRSNADILDISQIRNKKVALPPEESLSSNWFISNVLKKQKLNLTDISDYKFLPNHYSVLYSVINEHYDIGIIREYLLKNISTERIKILLYSEPFPTSPIVALDDSKTGLEDIIEALIAVSSDSAKITRDWDNEFIHGFVKANKKDYDIIKNLIVK